MSTRENIRLIARTPFDIFVQQVGSVVKMASWRSQNLCDRYCSFTRLKSDVKRA